MDQNVRNRIISKGQVWQKGNRNMSNIKTGIQTWGLLMVLKAAYRHLLRPLVKKAIDNPDEDWDETVMEILDRLFDYKDEPKN